MSAQVFLYEEAFEESNDTMCAEDWDANYADTQAAWSLANVPEVVDYQEERERSWLLVAQVVGGIVAVIFCVIAVVVLIVTPRHQYWDTTPSTTTTVTTPSRVWNQMYMGER